MAICVFFFFFLKKKINVKIKNNYILSMYLFVTFPLLFFLKEPLFFLSLKKNYVF